MSRNYISTTSVCPFSSWL